MDSISRTKGGKKVKELYYIAASDSKPKPGIIGRLWRHGTYRDAIWNEDTGRSIYGPEFDLELPAPTLNPVPAGVQAHWDAAGQEGGAGA
ncbi:hypothetical protein [Hymenobacter algoricola]|uniref:hypothetical protein n=1 Tax=Hymenobacter algoricola TaxID=486267 RepID=UPI0031ED3A0E